MIGKLRCGHFSRASAHAKCRAVTITSFRRRAKIIEGASLTSSETTSATSWKLIRGIALNSGLNVITEEGSGGGGGAGGGGFATTATFATACSGAPALHKRLEISS